jgi:hypothetical protein
LLSILRYRMAVLGSMGSGGSDGSKGFCSSVQ